MELHKQSILVIIIIYFLLISFTYNWNVTSGQEPPNIPSKDIYSPITLSKRNMINIDQNKTNTPVLFINNERDLIIENLLFQNISDIYKRALTIENSQNITLRSNVFSTIPMKAIQIVNSDNIVIEHNMFVDVKSIAIDIDSTSNFQIVNNTILNSNIAMSMFNVSDVNIRENMVDNVASGIGMFFASDVVIEDNVLQNINIAENIVLIGAIEVDTDKGSVTINNNVISRIRFIWAIRIGTSTGKDLVISNNIVTDSNSVAILAGIFQDTIITNNTLKDIETGINVNDLGSFEGRDQSLQSNLKISHNKISNFTDHAVRLTKLDSFSITDNVFENSKSSKPALQITTGTNAIIKNNVFRNVDQGLHFGASDGIIAENQFISTSTYSLRIFRSTSVNIDFNTFMNSSGTVIHLMQSSFIIIKNNYFGNIAGTILLLEKANTIDIENNEIVDLEGKFIDESFLAFNQLTVKNNTIGGEPYNYSRFTILEKVFIIFLIGIIGYRFRLKFKGLFRVIGR